jgi:hypothetical protein
MANGALGNTFSTIATYAYGGSKVEAGTTAYDIGTHAVEGSVEPATAPVPITELARSRSKLAGKLPVKDSEELSQSGSWGMTPCPLVWRTSLRPAGAPTDELER